MIWTRREFLGAAGLLTLTGCARLAQSRLGSFAPEFVFGEDGPLRIAVMANLRLSSSRDAGVVGRAVNALNNDPTINFVTVLGNLTNQGTLRQMILARRALDRLNAPYFCVPGSRDIAGGTEDGPGVYQRTFGKPQWKENFGGWAFIGLDTSGWESNTSLLGGVDFSWLDEQLNHLDRDLPTALFCHHPLNPYIDGVPQRPAAMVLERFQRHNLRLVVSSCHPGNEPKAYNGIQFVTSAKCVDEQVQKIFPRAQGFRIFTLNNEQFTHEFVGVPT